MNHVSHESQVVNDNLQPPFDVNEQVVRNQHFSDLAILTLNYKLAHPLNYKAKNDRNIDAFEDYYQKSNLALSQLKRDLQFSLSLELGNTSMAEVEGETLDA